MYVWDAGTPNFIKQTLLNLKAQKNPKQWEWKSSILHCHQIGHPDTKINKDISELNDTTDDMDLTEI
jgi:hypothetical protein